MNEEPSPAMIQAGLLEFADRDRWGESDEEVISRIYRAMVFVRRQGWHAYWSRRLNEMVRPAAPERGGGLRSPARGGGRNRA